MKKVEKSEHKGEDATDKVLDVSKNTKSDTSAFPYLTGGKDGKKYMVRVRIKTNPEIEGYEEFFIKFSVKCIEPFS